MRGDEGSQKVTLGTSQPWGESHSGGFGGAEFFSSHHEDQLP